MSAGAAEELRAAGGARRQQAPRATEEIRGAGDIGQLELDAAQPHASCFAIPASCRSSAGLLLAIPKT